MDGKFLNKLAELAPMIMENPYAYLAFSMLMYCLGGFDEILKALFCLSFLDIVVCLISSNKNNKGLFKRKLKIYIIIIVGVMLDRLLGLEHSPVTRARTCLILGYAYNEISSIVNTLHMDGDFYLPSAFKGYINKLKEKEKESDIE